MIGVVRVPKLVTDPATRFGTITLDRIVFRLDQKKSSLKA